VHHDRRRKWVATEKTIEFRPVHTSPLTPAVQPLAPRTRDEEEETGESPIIASNAVVGIVPTNLQHQLRVLLLDRQMTKTATPLGYRDESPAESSLGRFTLEHPTPLPVATPEVGKTQQVERPGPSSTFAVGPHGVPRWPAKLDEVSLLRM
jgi:hypothetical protein